MSERSVPTSLTPGALERLLAGLPAPSGLHPLAREPVHVVYGGAHLFKRDIAPKLGRLALRALDEHAPDAATFAQALGLLQGDARAPLVDALHQRVRAKLEREPVEDYRIDFEDGYGVRGDDEEDAHAAEAARELGAGAGTAPACMGIRVKALNEASGARALRTLDVFLTAFAVSGAAALPERFVVTLPKVAGPAEVAALAAALDALEKTLGYAPGSVGVEIMVEHPALIGGSDADATHPLRAAVDAAGGRCVGAHFGPYDYTTALGVAGRAQTLHHPACRHARLVMQTVLAGTGVRLSDGPTKILPVAPHRGGALSEEEREANRRAVHEGWRWAATDVTTSLHEGFYQGWDLHPAQLPARYAAVFLFFREAMEEAGARLRSFIEAASRASRLGARFDDASSAQGLLAFFRRGLACGALDESEAALVTGVDASRLRSVSMDELR